MCFNVYTYIYTPMWKENLIITTNIKFEEQLIMRKLYECFIPDLYKIVIANVYPSCLIVEILNIQYYMLHWHTHLFKVCYIDKLIFFQFREAKTVYFQ